MFMEAALTRVSLLLSLRGAGGFENKWATFWLLPGHLEEQSISLQMSNLTVEPMLIIPAYGGHGNIAVSSRLA